MPPSEAITRADSCSPAVCGPGVWNAAGGKGFIVQPPWMPHFLELREKQKSGMEGGSRQHSISDNRVSSRRRQQASFGDLAEELVDIILDMVWQMETRFVHPSLGAPVTAQPLPGGGSISGSGSDSRPNSSGSADGSGSNRQTCANSASSSSSSSSASSVAAALQPEISRRPARAEVAAWASYRLVCRRWDTFFRQKSLALRFEAPMTDAQMQWLASGPAIVRSLCFAAGEQRAFRVLGSYQFQAASAPALTTLRGVPLSNAADLTTRLDDFPKLHHLHAAGGSSALRFAELPPSLRTLEVEGLARSTMRLGLPSTAERPPTGEAAGSGSSGPAAPAPIPTPAPLPPTNPSLRSINLSSSDTLQLNPDWLAGLQGEVSIDCKDLVMPLPPKQFEGESRFMRVETLAALLVNSGINSLRLRFQEIVLLDFVASAWPVVVYVLLEGGVLWEVLRRKHEGAFEILKGDGGVVLKRRQ